MKTITRSFLVVIFLLGAAAGVSAQRLTVDEAVRLALEHNLGLKQRALDLGTKKRAAGRAWNSLIPQASVSGLVSRPTSLTGPVAAPQDVWTPGVQLSAGLNLSASLAANIAAARAGYEAGRLSYEQARVELEAQVRKLFYQILLLEGAKEVAARSLASAEARHRESAALARSGQAAHLDEVSARVDMESQKPALRNAEAAYLNALDSLKTLLALPLDAQLTLDGSIDSALAEGAASGADGVAAEAAGGTLETAALRSSMKTLEAQRNAARLGAYVPALRLSWSGTPLYIESLDTWQDSAGSFSLTLALNLDNFLPWSTAKTQIDDLSGRIAAAALQLDEAERAQASRAAASRRTIAQSRAAVAALQLNVELAASAYALYEDAYRKGAADYQRLRAAADSLVQAQNQVQQEQFNLVCALLDLEKELNLPFGSLR